MSLSNPNSIITEQRLSEFYQSIYPYLGSGGESHVVYGFHISNSESVPSSKVTYLADAVGMTPAHMDYTNDVFDYGSWADAFFMPRPCMLKYDGTVDYYLDPNDYTKKEDGTASDVANTSYAGNAMMEWGQNGKKIWLKIKPIASDNNKSADIYIADYNVDGSYTCWPFHNAEGDMVDHFYTAIYSGSLISSKLRSLSGQQVNNAKTCQQDIDYAVANNPTNKNIWNLEVVADVTLINMLLMLMTKTTDLQTAIGKGLTDSGTSEINGAFRTGIHNTKGLFYGTNSGTASTYTNAVKVFGMENWWGLHWRRYLGEITASGVRKRKMCYGQEDGSTVTGYNITGNGYINCNVSLASGASENYFTEAEFSSLGMFPTKSPTGSSNSTYYSDGYWFHNTETNACISQYGGASTSGGLAGPLAVRQFLSSTYTSWACGDSISAKPLSS